MDEDSDYAAALGRGIRAARHEAGITQEDLAAELGVRQAAVSHWELGHKSPTAANIFRIAAALGVTPDAIFRYLLQGEPAPARRPAGGRSRDGRSRT